MKKVVVLILVMLTAAMFFVSYGENANDNALSISGLPDSGIVCEETYYPIAAMFDGKHAECNWTISDPAAARISSAKKLFINNIDKPIKFMLTAEYEEEGVTACVEITAVPAAKSIRIWYEGKNEDSGALCAELSEGPVQFALVGIALPNEAGAALTWMSTNEDVATVDADGNVTVVGSGSAKITVNTVNKKQAEITVYGYYAPTSVVISAPNELALKDTAMLECIVYPEKAKGARLSFTSSDEKTISVNGKGEIRALRAGTAEITVSASNGVSSSVMIECYKPVSLLSIDSIPIIAVGETRQLNVTVMPTDAKYKEVKFASKTPEIADVDENGYITGKSDGTARIIVRSSNGIVAEKNVRVKFVRLKSLVNDSYFESLTPGETLAYPVSFNPVNASNRKLFFESRNPDIASVDENGIITAHTMGRTEIICKSESAACEEITLNIRVKSGEDALPLEGIIVGLNPGHQITRDYTQLPVGPGWKQTKNANSGYVIGIKTGIPEYQITLDVSLILREKLEALGAKVVMTRTANDVKINNIERALMLNEAGCDIALQVHCNNSAERWRKGFFVFTKVKDLESQAIGDQIYIGTHEAAGTDISYCRRHDGYMSLNWSTTPAVLLELGYMSNPQEDVLLSTSEYQELLADGIAKGLVYYFN